MAESTVICSRVVETKKKESNDAICQGGNGTVKESYATSYKQFKHKTFAGETFSTLSLCIYRDHGNAVCLSRTFPFGQKSRGSDVVVISGDPHPSIDRREGGCRSRTMTDQDHLPFWGAEIGQWLGKHVPLSLSLLLLSPSLPLSLYLPPTLSHFYPIPTKPKIAKERERESRSSVQEGGREGCSLRGQRSDGNF